MGFTVQYRSTRPVTSAEADAIRRDADAASDGRAWLYCEPVHLEDVEDDGTLIGFSKPNFRPHPDDAASAARSGLPAGTCRDMLDILCQLSRDHGIDWALGHDYDPDIGSIRGGVCDPSVLNQIEGFDELADILGEFDPDADG